MRFGLQSKKRVTKILLCYCVTAEGFSLPMKL